MNNYDYRVDMIPNVVSYATGDVNGDRIPDKVYLTGIKTPSSPFIQNITLVIQDGATGRCTSIPIKDNAGYNPTLFLGDFTGNSVDDILISIASGGSGGIMYYYIYHLLTISHDYCLTLMYITINIHTKSRIKTIIKLKLSAIEIIQNT